MSVIIAEERLDELFKTLPIIDGGSDPDLKPVFEFGTVLDLSTFLNDQSKLNSYPYPLVFMETPVKATGGADLITIPLTLILATRTVNTFTPRERLDSTIKQRLKPLLNYVIYSLEKGSTTRIIKERNNFNNSYSHEIFYNYGEKIDYSKDGGTEHVTSDIWDAIRFKCNLEVNNSCLLPLKY